MKIFDFVYYFIINLFGGNSLPILIDYNNDIWFSLCGYSGKYWFFRYSKHIDKFITEELIEVRSRFKYVVYMKMLYWLWKMRKRLIITHLYF